MSLLAWLPLAATTLFSEKVPTLSEPRMIQIPAGTTLFSAPVGDSVLVGSKGLGQGFLRSGSSIVSTGGKQSDTINLTTPNLSPTGVLATKDSLFRIWYRHIYPATGTTTVLDFRQSASPHMNLGDGYHFLFNRTHSVYNSSNPDDNYEENLICGQNQIVRDRRYAPMFPDNPLVRRSTLAFSGIGHSVCDYHKLATIAWPLGNGYWALKTDSMENVIDSGRYDSLKSTQLDWLVNDKSGRWLAFDQSTSRLYWRIGTSNSPFTFGSMTIPGLAREKRPCYQVSRVDSIVTFAVDSQIVFLKWTPDEVKVVAKYSIPGKIIQAVSMPDSGYALESGPASRYIKTLRYVWATTGTELYSFKFSMEEPPVSSASPSPSRSALFALQHNPQGASFTWYGSGTEIVRMTGIDGRAHGTVELRPGATANWTAPHPGLYLAHTPDGVKRILAR